MSYNSEIIEKLNELTDDEIKAFCYLQHGRGVYTDADMEALGLTLNPEDFS